MNACLYGMQQAAVHSHLSVITNYQEVIVFYPVLYGVVLYCIAILSCFSCLIQTVYPKSETQF